MRELAPQPCAAPDVSKRRGMTARLEHDGTIGDGESAALVSRDCSIGWLCWSRFGSDACFANLLGRRACGYRSIAPHAPRNAGTDRTRSGYRTRGGGLQRLAAPCA